MSNHFSSNDYIRLGNATELSTSLNPTQFLSSASLFDSEPILSESRSSRNSQKQASFLHRSINSLRNYFSSDRNNLDTTDLADLYTSASAAQYLPLSSQYSRYYGDGLVNAAAAVARSVNQSAFSDVWNYGGYNWGVDAIQAPEVWARGYTGQGIVVAVVDSGVDYTHYDLNDNIWVNWGETFGNGIDDDRNGYIDDAIGWNFVDNNYNPMDYSGHGTHVAGIIAAENDSYGAIGVAFNSKIMPVRVLGANGGTTQNIAQGIIYAANNGADVINLSLGGTYFSEDVAAAVRYATERGSFVVMAAGNDGGSQPYYPAHLATSWGIAVGAIGNDSYMASFSNLAGSNPNLRYVAAPGVGIYSTYLNNSYAYLDGTSMAAPFVSGVAALMLSANAYLSPGQMRQILAETAIG